MVGRQLRGCLNGGSRRGWWAALQLKSSETGASPLCIAEESSCERQTINYTVASRVRWNDKRERSNEAFNM